MRQSSHALAYAAVGLGLSGCDFIGDVFEAGFWTGAIGVVIVVALLIWVISRIFR